MKPLFNAFETDVNQQVENVVKTEWRYVRFFIALNAVDLLSEVDVLIESTYKVKVLVANAIDEKDTNVVFLDQFEENIRLFDPVKRDCYVEEDRGLIELVDVVCR